MTLKNKNPWKYLSVGLLGVIAIGLVTPINAAPENSQGNSSILDLLLDGTFGLEAISSDIGTVQASVDAIDTSGLATQASVDAVLDKLCSTTATDLSEKDLSGCDLSGKDLSGKDLTGADLTGADLTGADLTGATLTGAEMLNVDLTGATLTDATMLNVDLTGASLGSFYIDDTFVCGEKYEGFDITCTNNCDSGGLDTPISVLEFDGIGDGPKFDTGIEYDFVNPEPTTFTILCEDTT